MSDNISSRPLVHQLVEYLSPLVHWQTFGIHLPNITNSTIEQIEADHQGTERRKLALYARWLTEYSDATWDHVYDALKKESQHELASVLERKLLVSHSAKQLEVEERKVEVKIETADEIATQLVGLHNRFAQLETNIRDTLDTAVTGGQIAIKHISRYLERHLEDEQLILTDSKDIDDLFHKLRPYFSFLDCELIEKIVQQFVQGDAQTKLKEYVTDVEAFEELTTLQELKDAIEQALLPTQSVTPSTCEVILKVSRRWRREKMKCLNKLLEHVFFDKSHLLKHIRITVGSMCIRFLVPKSQAEMLIALVAKHMEFMYLLGVFEMMINDIPVLMEDENENFTFDSALLESSQSGNNEAVQFLLDLGVNVNYSNSEGKTALILASEAGHEEVVRMLVLAGANVNNQDSAGQTALMLANGNVGIIRCLLLANANLDIQRQDGNTALHIACYKGHNTVIELLLSYHASPVIKNTKDDTPFMASVRGNNADILKLMLDAIPSSHLSSGIVLACRLGHSAVFSLLVKQLECTPQVIDLFISCAEGDAGSVIQHIMEFNIDPNTTLISGITPLMIASSCGHVEVIDTLIQMEADVNRIDTDNYSPLAYAITGNKSLPTVQYLLEAGANPHVLLGGITILERAYREEGQQDICDILFKFSALDLQNRFTHLLDRVEEGFDVLIGKEKDILLHVSQFLEVYPEITGSSKVHDSTDLFSRVRAYSDMLSYELLVVIAREFLKYNVEIQEELEEYLSVVQKFEQLFKIEHFVNAMAFLPQQEKTTMATTTYLVFKLNRNWSNKTLKILHNLYSFLFSDNQRYLSHMTVDIVEKVPCIKFLIPNSTQIIEDLVSEVAKKRQLMYLLGVFEMMINNTPVLMEDEDKNFTFESAIQKAVQFGNNEAVQLLLDLSNVDRTHNESKACADPNVHSNERFTALILASECGNQQIVELLLEKQVDPNVQNRKNRRTALIQASQNGHYQVVDILLKKGADPNIHDNKGWTALLLASENGHQQVVELLLEKQVDPNVQNRKNRRTALILASGNGHYQVVEILLKKGADPNIHDNDGWTALIVACQFGHQQVMELLLEKQVDLNVQNSKDGRTAFLQASMNGHYQVVELLLKKGADPNIRDNEGFTALLLASENGHQQVVELLLEEQVDPNVQNSENGKTALFLASIKGHYQVVEILLKKVADPNIRTEDGVTALIFASMEGHYQVVEILLEKGADPNIHDNYGWTALIVASEKGHQQVVELLFEKQVDPNVRNSKNGRTALIQASKNGHYQVVDILLKKGADPNIPTENGETALIFASMDGHCQVVEILLQKGADPLIHDNDGWTALIVACQNGHSDIIEVLLRYNANPHYFVTIDGVSLDSLALAVGSRNIECVNILLKHTELSLKGLSMGWYYACGIGHVPIIKLFSNRLDIVSDQRDLIISCAEGDLGSVVDQLMSGKITPDVQFVHGVTPLMISSSCGHIDIVEALIKAGANVNKTDEFGCTALDFAEAAKQDATKNILLQHGGSKGPGTESESHETTSEEQKLSTDTSQNTIKSSQDSLSIRKKELNTKKRPFLIMKKLFKDTVKYSQSIFSPHERFDNREYSTTTHIPIL